ncbi:hypothetical protein [Serratia fonticola]|uniref:hypothetical protein n=1 Tax=Serratia fonticola TaxID=47917 RepID=UPI001376D7DA|nr:hypothetical protein [Serratia fonticola]NCG55159.1 hypothetical protein [Serratia fonticola]
MSEKLEALSRLNFEKWMAGDYSPDRSPEATSAGEDAFKSVMWHIYSSAQLPLLAALEEKGQRIADAEANGVEKLAEAFKLWADESNDHEAERHWATASKEAFSFADDLRNGGCEDD